MANLKINWEHSALRSLDNRDRYTRKAIVQEFGENPEAGALPFDHDAEGHVSYVTQVADKRYSVVWRFEPDRGTAVVLAVVALPKIGDPSGKPPEVRERELKEYVQRAVQAESKGEILL